jgi:hypothetical protein
MASIGGRISSARLLRSARAHRVKVNENPSSNDNFELNSVQNVNTKDTYNSQENQESKNVFLILTSEILEEKKQLLKERKKKNKEKKNKVGHKEDTGKLVDGIIVYENRETYSQDVDYSKTDTTLEEGNQLPERLGKFPIDLLHKPLIELGIYSEKNF